MLSRLAVIGALGAGLVGVPDTARDQALLGQWKGDTAAGRSIGTLTLNLFPNGTYSRTVSTSAAFGWTLEGDMLILAPVTGIVQGEITYGNVSALKVRFDGDSLIASHMGKYIVMHRVTSPVKDAPLLGRWMGDSDLNETITQDFTVDGQLIVTATISQDAGRYTIGKDEIEFEEQIPKPGKRRNVYELKGDKLLLFVNRRLPPLELTRIPLEVPAS
jgi:hypothetical protein